MNVRWCAFRDRGAHFSDESVWVIQSRGAVVDECPAGLREWRMVGDMDGRAGHFASFSAELAAFVDRLPVPVDVRSDIVQRTLEVAWRRRAVFDAQPSDEAQLRWLRGVAFFIARNQARSDRRQDRLLGRLQSSVRREDLVARLDSDHFTDATVDALIGAISEATVEDRTLLMDHFWEGRSVRQLAVAHEVSEVAMRKRISRARLSVRHRTLEILAEQDTPTH